MVLSSSQLCWGQLVLVVVVVTAVVGELSASTYIAHGWGFGEPVAFSDEVKFGSVFRYDAVADEILSREVEVEVVCGGFSWVEGPVFVPGVGILFSDVRRNTIYRYDGDRCEVFRKAAGCSDSCEWEQWIEPGPNGMAVNPTTGEVVLCQHGNRSVVAAQVSEHGWERQRLLASHHNRARLNSPNDVVVMPSGDLYFTDPSYGLQDIGTGREHKGQLEAHSQRELNYNGIYYIPANALKKGCVEPRLVADSSRPNGVAYAPDHRTLYVSNSDPKRPIVTRYSILEDGSLAQPDTLVDFKALTEIYPELRGPGGVDGMSVDVKGFLYQTVPSGVAILSPAGRMVALIWLGLKVGNCALDRDGYLYIAADTYIIRIRGNFQSLLLKDLHHTNSYSDEL